jgi:putative zinc finger/helix-turn-helix YgiT family protein
MAEKQRQPKPFPHRCPECGATAVYAETIDYKTGFKYEGHLHEFEVQAISVNKCRACGHTGLPNTALDQITESFRRHARLLTAQQIRDALQELQLTQKDFAELLGVAPETVSRWLKNVQIQTRSLDRLMRLFFKSAELRKDLADMNRGAPIQAEGVPNQAEGVPRENGVLVIRGRIQKGVVVLEAASVPEGTEVAVVVPAATKAANEEILNAQRQRVLQIMDRIAAMPIDAVDEPFSGAEHGNVLHSP